MLNTLNWMQFSLSFYPQDCEVQAVSIVKFESVAVQVILFEFNYDT